MDSPPVPKWSEGAVKSPPWHIKSLITLWKIESLWESGLPDFGDIPLSPVHGTEISCCFRNNIVVEFENNTALGLPLHEISK